MTEIIDDVMLYSIRTLAQARIAELKKRGQALGAPSMEKEAELRRLVRRLEVY